MYKQKNKRRGVCVFAIKTKRLASIKGWAITTLVVFGNIASMTLLSNLAQPSQAAGAPTITSVAPNRGTTAGGTKITITGSGFVPKASDVEQLTSGGSHTCGILDGAAWCWGNNGYGRLGDNSTIDRSVPVRVNTSNMTGTVTAISASGGHTCAVASNQVWCWGDNSSGQLGNNSTVDSLVPVRVNTSNMAGTVTAISAGRYYTCAVVGGKAWCWGDNWSSQLGNNSTNNSIVPVQVSASSMTGTVTAISAGAEHTCAIASNQAWCWGDNSAGQLGNNSTDNSPVPVRVNTSSMTDVIMSITSGGGHTCAIASNQAWCWGINWYGQLGNNSLDRSAIPVRVNTSSMSGPTTSISAGAEHTCAIASNQAWCWGNNSAGQLGNSLATEDPVQAPTRVVSSSMTSSTTAISSGGEHSCAIADNQAWCWGRNALGQLGNSSQSDSLAPVRVDASNFPTSPPSITVASQTCTNTVLVDSATISCITPPRAAGEVDVIVTNGDGQTATLTNGYEYVNPQPEIESITPNRGPVAGGSDVTIKGGNFQSAQNWTAQSNSGNRNWYSVASSADGMNLVAGDYNGYLYTSTDGGLNWTERTGAGKEWWRSIASSADGVRLITGAGTSGYLYTSNDGGATWTERTSAGSRDWSSLASSSNGTKLIAGTDGGYLYTSNDGGATWTERTSAGSRVWSSLASSSDGMHLIACAGGVIYISTDGGVSWTAQLSVVSTAWSGVTSSADGMNAAAIARNGSIFTSIDGGDNWMEQVSIDTVSYSYQYAIASSADGTKLIASAENDFIYTSSNGGTTWKRQSSVGQGYWNAVASSADGARLAAVSYDDFIYTGVVSSSAVTIGGQPCRSTIHIDPTTITCATPTHLIGPVDVTVMNGDGQSATLTSGFTYYDKPTVPQNFTAVPAAGGIILTWGAPTNDNFSTINSYCYQYRVVDTGTWLPSDTTCTKTSTGDTMNKTTIVTIPTITAGKTHEFRISAVNEAGQGSYTTNNPTAQTMFITISADNTVEMTVSPTSSEVMSSTKTTVNVKTNNSGGHRLMFSAAGTDTHLVKTDDTNKTIAPLGFLPSAPGQIIGTLESKWGWRMDGLAGFGDTPTAAETNKPTSSYTWAGIPSTTAPYTLRQTAAPNASDITDPGTDTDVWFAASATANQPPGSYVTKVIWTAVSNM